MAEGKKDPNIPEPNEEKTVGSALREQPVNREPAPQPEPMDDSGLSELIGTLLAAGLGAAVDGSRGARLGAAGAATRILDDKERLADLLAKQQAAQAELAQREKERRENQAIREREREEDRTFKAEQNKLSRTSRASSDIASADRLATALMGRSSEKGTDFATQAILEKDIQVNDSIAQAQSVIDIIDEGQASGALRKNETIVRAVARNLGVKINPNTKAGELNREVVAQGLQTIKDLVKGGSTERENALVEAAQGRSSTVTMETLREIQEIIKARRALGRLRQEDVFIERGLEFPGSEAARERRAKFGTARELFNEYSETADTRRIMEAFEVTSLSPSTPMRRVEAQEAGQRAARVGRAKDLIQRLKDKKKNR